VSLRDPTVRDVVGAVGVVAFAVGVVASFAPDRLPGALLAVVDAVEAAVEAWVAVLVLSLVVFAYAIYRFWRADDGAVERLVPEGDGEQSVPALDDAVVDFDTNRPGRAFDYAMRRTVAQLEADPNADAWEADRVRGDLETAVVAALMGRGREVSAARAAVEDGSWTDERVPAAFLGGPDAPGVGLRGRVHAWLFPERAFRGRVERVVDEIERLAGDGGHGTEPGDATGAVEDGDVEGADPGASVPGDEGVGS
jgi:hypothetical protein